MTTTLNDLIEDIEPELKTLLLDGAINVRHVWFGDINPVDVQSPSVHFMLNSTKRNDMQVIQSSSRISWDLEYDVPKILREIYELNTDRWQSACS